MLKTLSSYWHFYFEALEALEAAGLDGVEPVQLKAHNLTLIEELKNHCKRNP